MIVNVALSVYWSEIVDLSEVTLTKDFGQQLIEYFAEYHRCVSDNLALFITIRLWRISSPSYPTTIRLSFFRTRITK